PRRGAPPASRAGAGPPPLDHPNRRHGAPAIEHRVLAGSDALPETRVYERGGPRNGPPRPPTLVTPRGTRGAPRSGGAGTRGVDQDVFAFAAGAVGAGGGEAAAEHSDQGGGGGGGVAGG